VTFPIDLPASSRCGLRYGVKLNRSPCIGRGRFPHDRNYTKEIRDLAAALTDDAPLVKQFHVGIHVLLGRYLARLPSGPRALRRRRQDRDRAAVDRHVALIAQPVLATDEFDGASSGIIIYLSVRSDIFIEIHYDSEAERR